MHRKLESWAQQYTVLLSSGLEEQRRQFEARLAELQAAYAPPAPAETGAGRGGGRGAGRKKAAAAAAVAALTGEQVWRWDWWWVGRRVDASHLMTPSVSLHTEHARQVVAALKQERRQLEHRCLAARERLRKAR